MGGHRAGATDAAPDDRSCLDLKHLYLEELRRLLTSEKPRAWPRGIQWIIDYTETHPVGVHRCRHPNRGAEIPIWGDLHFDDQRIRRAAKTPWPLVEPMNDTLRRNWRESPHRARPPRLAGR